MRKTLDWAALPPTAKLCLQEALRHGGLVKTEHGYIGRTACRRTGPRFGAIAVACLMRNGLACAGRTDAQRVVLTEGAIALFHLRQARVEVAA